MKRNWAFWPVVAGVLTSGCAGLHPRAAPPQVASHTRINVSRFAPTNKSLAMFDVMAAELAGQSGDAQTALAYYRKAMERLPDPVLARRTMEIATFLHNDEVALDAAKRWAVLEPGAAQPQQALGYLYARRGDIGKAALHLRRFIELDGEPLPQAFLVVGALLAEVTPPGNALAVMQRVVERYPGQSGADYAYGVLALRLGVPSIALEAANNALGLKAGMAEAISLKADAMTLLGHRDRAIRLLERALRKNPGSMVLHLAYARLLVSDKDYGRARTEFRWLLRRDGKNPDVLYTLGLLDFELKRDQEAKRYLNRLIGVGGHASAAQYFLGRIAERNGNMMAALSHYASVDTGRYLFDAEVRIAYILARQGDLDQAREYLSELRASVTDRTKKIELYLVEGALLQQADDAPTALALYNKALHKYPDTARLLYARALVSVALGDLKGAEAGFRQLLQANPRDVAALNAFGYILAEHTERFEEALGYIQRALALQPDNPAVLDSMGWVQFKLKHYRKASDYLERALARFQDPSVAGHLVQALVASGQVSKAKSVLDKEMKTFPGNPELSRLRQRLGL